MSVFATGEELGWRRYLQPRLSQRYGVRLGAVLTAFVSAFWHTGYHLAGMSFPQHVVVVGTLFAGPAMLIGFGTFLGWLYVRTGTLWLVVLAHASANAWSQFPLRFVDLAPAREGPLLALIGVGFLGLGASSLLWLPWQPRGTSNRSA